MVVGMGQRFMASALHKSLLSRIIQILFDIFVQKSFIKIDPTKNSEASCVLVRNVMIIQISGEK